MPQIECTAFSRSLTSPERRVGSNAGAALIEHYRSSRRFRSAPAWLRLRSSSGTRTRESLREELLPGTAGCQIQSASADPRLWSERQLQPGQTLVHVARHPVSRRIGLAEDIQSRGIAVDCGGPRCGRTFTRSFDPGTATARAKHRPVAASPSSALASNARASCILLRRSIDLARRRV
jgi:hypothetical protein